MKPINGWTKQGIIDHINKEFTGKSMMDDGQTCAYRGENGHRCAVGIFIPNTMYSATMERSSIEHMIKKFPEIETILPLPLAYMSKLQGIHDASTYGVQTIKEKMIQFIETNVEEV